MENKSSTSLAISSILVILVVFFIMVSNVEEAPQRKAFLTKGANQVKQLVDVDLGQKNPENNLTKTIVQVQKAETLPDEKRIDTAVTAENFLVKNINSEILIKSGFKNIVLKPRPFNGQLFEKFDLEMLSQLNIMEKSIMYLANGNETEVLHAYEFDFSDNRGAEEVYDFLKAKIKDQLGVTINQTNQFGLSSFYINFSSPLENAFLVVKTQTNVYALSYPKAELDGVNYFNLVSNLLKELI